MIAKCTCQNAGQDKLYGLGMRVFNEFKGKKGNDARCTVCGSTKQDV